MSREHILIVDDEPKERQLLEVMLRQGGYLVTPAGSGEEALVKITISPPALVVCEAVLPDMSGLDLLRQANEQSPAPVHFLFLTRHPAIETKIAYLEAGAAEYLTKPIYIREVITRIQMILERRQRDQLAQTGETVTGLTGALSDVSLVDILQTIENSTKTGVLTIEFAGQSGEVYFRNGRVIDATCGVKTGAAAVYRLMLWKAGVFQTRFEPVEREDTVRMSTQGLLMEGARRLDEWSRLQELLPPLHEVHEVNIPELIKRLADLPDDVNPYLRLLDGTHTLIEVVDALTEVDDLAALEMLSKLYFEGMIRPDASPPPMTSRPVTRGSAPSLPRYTASFKAVPAPEASPEAAASAPAPNPAPKAASASIPDLLPAGDDFEPPARKPQTGLVMVSHLPASVADATAVVRDLGIPDLDTVLRQERAEKALKPPISQPFIRVEAKPAGTPSRVDLPRVPAATPAPAPSAPPRLDDKVPPTEPPAGEPPKHITSSLPAAAAGAVPNGPSAPVPTPLAPPEPPAVPLVEPPQRITSSVPQAIAAPTPTREIAMPAISAPAPAPDRPQRQTLSYDDQVKAVASPPEPAAPGARPKTGPTYPLSRPSASTPSAPPAPVPAPARAAASGSLPSTPATRVSAPRTSPSQPSIPHGDSKAIDALTQALQSKHKLGSGAANKKRPKRGGSKWWPALGGLLALAIAAAAVWWAQRSNLPASPEAPSPAQPAAPAPAPPLQPEPAPSPPAPAPAPAPEPAASPPVAQPAATATPAAAPATPAATAAPPAPPQPTAAPPTNPALAVALAKAQTAIDGGKYGAARKTLTPWLAKYPDHPRLLTLLAYVAYGLGDLKNAGLYVNQAITADPAFAEAYLLLGSLQQSLQKNTEAKAAYERFLQLAPSHPHAGEIKAIVNKL